MMNDKWLDLAHRVQAIAHTGLTYGTGVYDLERYEALREISLEMFSLLSQQQKDILREYMKVEPGYATPKVDIRAVVLKENKILLVQEKSDHCWALPGGWADIGLSPSEVAEKEVEEEAGIKVKAKRLLGILDKKKHPHPPYDYYTYKVYIHCTHLEGDTHPGVETEDVAYYAINNLPALSEERNVASQVKAVYERAIHPELPLLFD